MCRNNNFWVKRGVNIVVGELSNIQLRAGRCVAIKISLQRRHSIRHFHGACPCLQFASGNSILILELSWVRLSAFIHVCRLCVPFALVCSFVCGKCILTHCVLHACAYSSFLLVLLVTHLIFSMKLWNVHNCCFNWKYYGAFF